MSPITLDVIEADLGIEDTNGRYRSSLFVDNRDPSDRP